MRFYPHKYQDRAINFLLDNAEAALLLDMGLGKTISVLTAFDELKYGRGEVQSMIVVAPLRVTHLVWKQEAKKWNHTKHLRVVTLHGKDKNRNLHKRADIYLINYDGLQWLSNQLRIPGNGFPQNIDMLVFDESTCVKTYGSNRSKISRALAMSIKRRVILTGTPAPNSQLDIWHQIYLLDFGKRLGPSYTGFRAQHFVKTEGQSRYFPRAGVTDWTTKRINDICLVMEAKDHLTLPERIDNKIEICLPDALKDQYDELEREFFLELDGTGVTAFNAASLTMKLRQFTQGFVYNDELIHIIHTKKIEALREIVDGSGTPILVAIQFRHEAEFIKQEFGDVPVIYGGTKTSDTQKYVKQWNKGNVPILAAHPASLSHGVNLQYGGHTIVWLGLTWSLEQYLQFNARLERQGQENSIIIHHIVMKKTIDEVVLRTLETKTSTQQNMIKQLKGYRDAKIHHA